MVRSSVLVVDDEESMRYFLERSLKRRGFRVRAVSTGEAAVDEVRRSAPDIVLLDLMLPGLSGIDVLKETRRTAPGAAVGQALRITSTTLRDIASSLMDLSGLCVSAETGPPTPALSQAWSTRS